MEVAEALRRRRMVRAYDPARPLPPDVVDAVCAAALRAPSAGFTQGVSLLVAGTAESRETFWAATAGRESAWLRGMRSAPALIMLWTSRRAYLDRYAEPDKGWSDRGPDWWAAPYWYVDGGMAGMAALVTAVDSGLGACFFGIPAERVDRVRRRFDVPADQLSVGVISLGYPVAAPALGSPTRRARKATEELLHRESWNSPS